MQFLQEKFFYITLISPATCEFLGWLVKHLASSLSPPAVCKGSFAVLQNRTLALNWWSTALFQMENS